jgi:hypothetical protein
MEINPKNAKTYVKLPNALLKIKYKKPIMLIIAIKKIDSL